MPIEPESFLYEFDGDTESPPSPSIAPRDSTP